MSNHDHDYTCVVCRECECCCECDQSTPVLTEWIEENDAADWTAEMRERICTALNEILDDEEAVDCTVAVMRAIGFGDAGVAE